jgi:hypothetical protein
MNDLEDAAVRFMFAPLRLLDPCKDARLQPFYTEQPAALCNFGKCVECWRLLPKRRIIENACDEREFVVCYAFSAICKFRIFWLFGRAFRSVADGVSPKIAL